MNNLGAVRIRIRSLIAAMKKMRREEQIQAPAPLPVDFERVEYTEAMQLEGYTILAPR